MVICCGERIVEKLLGEAWVYISIWVAVSIGLFLSQKRFFFVCALLVCVLNVIYWAFPILFDFRIYWVPFFEEALKAVWIKHKWKNQPEGFFSLKFSVAGTFGVVDGISQIPERIAWLHKQSYTLNAPFESVFAAASLTALAVILLHLGFAIFYFKSLTHSKMFFVVPLIVHLFWNVFLGTGLK